MGDTRIVAHERRGHAGNRRNLAQFETLQDWQSPVGEKAIALGFGRPEQNRSEVSVATGAAWVY